MGASIGSLRAGEGRGGASGGRGADIDSSAGVLELRQQELKDVLCMLPSTSISKELLLSFCVPKGGTDMGTGTGGGSGGSGRQWSGA